MDDRYYNAVSHITTVLWVWMADDDSWYGAREIAWENQFCLQDDVSVWDRQGF